MGLKSEGEGGHTGGGEGGHTDGGEGGHIDGGEGGHIGGGEGGHIGEGGEVKALVPVDREVIGIHSTARLQCSGYRAKVHISKRLPQSIYAQQINKS